jgi:hypothetical protein
MMHIAAVLISLAATVAASSQSTPTASPTIMIRGCYSDMSDFKEEKPSPTSQTAFTSYMASNDPFKHQCVSAPVPGISLVDRNRFYEDYAKQAEWYVFHVFAHPLTLDS